MYKPIILTLALLFVSATAEVPHIVTYQGRLTDLNGDPLEGDFNLTFTIYDAPEGGNALWTSGPHTVAVEDGLFSYDLGMISPIPDSVFLQHFERWLGIQVGTEAEMLPRTVINSVAFSYRAQYADAAGMSESTAEAEHALFADTALYSFDGGHAAEADHSLESDHALLSDNALFVDTAQHSFNADHAAFADTADYAHGAEVEHSIFSDTALYSIETAHSVEADHSIYADTAAHSSESNHAAEAEHAVFADTAAYAHAAPGGGFSLPYAGTVTDAGNAFYVDNNGTGSAVRGDSEGEDGVVGWTNETSKSGVYGYSPLGRGVTGRAEGENHGVYGESNSSTPGFAGVKGHNLGSGPGVYAYGSDIGLYADASDVGVAGLFDGDVDALGNLTAVVDSGMAGRFISDSLGSGDSGVIYASYAGKGMGTFPAAVIGISHTTDSVGMGAYFEGDYLGLLTMMNQEEDMGDRIGLWSWILGGTDANRNWGVRSEVTGDGNSVNWGVESVAEGGDFNYGIVAKGQAPYVPFYPGIRNYGGYFEATYADTCIVIESYTNVSEYASYGLYASVYNSDLNYGAYFDVSSDSTNYGVYAHVSGGTSNTAIYGSAPFGGSDWAGYFIGDVYIGGTLYGGKNGTKVDHPLDPENKYLIHSSVESPEMLNVYNGNVITDGSGRAIVNLPDYFEAYNTDFRYQLTVIGEFAQAIIAEEIRNNQFVIRTDIPNVKVSWQVTGVRNDALARARPIETEMEKPFNKQGTYLNPAAFGLGEGFSEDYETHHNRHSPDDTESPVPQSNPLSPDDIAQGIR